MKRLLRHLIIPHHNRNPKNNLDFKFHLCLNQGSFHPWLLRHTKHTPPLVTFVATSTQSGVKLSKLVKEARLLGCETFSGTIDAIVAKNWLKKIFDTLNDKELDDSLKLKVATRFMDKSAATWWDNLKLRISTPITWELFVQEFNNQFYTRFRWDQKRKEFFRLK